jgi:copper(I)-binding protein
MPHKAAIAAILLMFLMLLSGCGAGQQAQTSNQVTSTGGVGGQVGSVVVRDAQFAWNGPVPGDTALPVGADARLKLTVVNEGKGRVDDGRIADRLVAVSSPIATAGRIVGDARIPDGQVLTAGYDRPLSSIELPGSSSVEIVLVGLTEPVRAGLTYPVALTFEHAGRLHLQLPVENPRVLPPRANE